MNATEQSIIKLTAGMETLTVSVDQLREDLRDAHSAEVKMAACVGQMQQSQITLNDSIASLLVIVRDGNGQPSLMQRMSHLETEHILIQHSLANLATGITQLNKHFNGMNTAKIVSRGQIVAGVLGMIVTAVIAALTLYFTVVPTVK